MIFFSIGGGGGEGGGGAGTEVGIEGRCVSDRNKQQQYIRLLFVHMLCLKFQFPSSNGSLVLTYTNGVMDM